MKLLAMIFEELFGMFVDDGALAIWSVVLIGLVAALVRFFGVPPLYAAYGLLAGCILILAESVMRASRGR